MISRKTSFHRILLSILFSIFNFLLISFTTSLAQEADEVYKVVQLSDTHLCNLDGYHPAFVQSRSHYGDGVESLRQFLTSRSRQMHVDAIIITGDLIDFFEAETAGGSWLSTQIEQFAPLFNQSETPLLMTLGNHNIQALFVGHGHTNVSELVPFPLGNEILQVETAAFAQNPENWRRVDFLESKIIVYQCGKESIELELSLK